MDIGLLLRWIYVTRISIECGDWPRSTLMRRMSSDGLHCFILTVVANACMDLQKCISFKSCTRIPLKNRPYQKGLNFDTEDVWEGPTKRWPRRASKKRTWASRLTLKTGFSVSDSNVTEGAVRKLWPAHSVSPQCRTLLIVRPRAPKWGWLY